MRYIFECHPCHFHPSCHADGEMRWDERVEKEFPTERWVWSRVALVGCGLVNAQLRSAIGIPFFDVSRRIIINFIVSAHLQRLLSTASNHHHWIGIIGNRESGGRSTLTDFNLGLARPSPSSHH